MLDDKKDKGSIRLELSPCRYATFSFLAFNQMTVANIMNTPIH